MSNKKFLFILAWIGAVAVGFTMIFMDEPFRTWNLECIGFLYLVFLPLIVEAVRRDWKKND
jgi:hypothetical protein